MAGNAGEVYLKIRVDDDGSIKVKEFGDELDKVGRDGSRSFDRMDDSARTLDGSLDNLRGIAVELAAAFGAYQLGMWAKDVTMAAARYETLGVVLETVGKNYNYSSSQLEDYTKALREGGIAMTESRSVLIDMIQAEMDLAQARDLSRIAQNAAVIGNTNSSYAFEQLVYGIQSAQIEVLRTIGINVNFEQSYKAAAKAIGKSTTALTEQEKVQIRTNAVIKAGQGIAGAYESAMSTAGKKVSSFTRYVEDFKIQMGEAFQPATVIAVDEATAAMKRLTDEVKDPLVQQRLAGLAETSLETAENLALIGGKVLSFAGSVAEGWNKLPEPIQQAGLLAAVIMGPKGMALMAGFSHMYGVADNMDKALDLIGQGRMTWSQFASMNATELATFINQVNSLEGYVSQLEALKKRREHIFKNSATQYVEGDAYFRDDELKKIDQDIAKLQKLVNAMKLAKKINDDIAADSESYNITDSWNTGGNPVIPDPDKTTTETDKVKRALEQVNDTIARITLSSKEYEQYAFDKKVAKLAEVLGVSNPKLQEMVAAFQTLQDKGEELKDWSLEEIAFDAEMRWAFDDTDFEEAERKQKAAEERNLQVMTEFSREYMRIVKGETEFRIAQIEEQARVWREAGADAVQVAEWEAQAKLDASRKWHDGAIRAFKSYADEASDAAANMATLVTNGLSSFEDELVNVTQTGKFLWRDMVDSMIEDLTRLMIRQDITAPMASGISSFMSSLFVANAHGGAYSSPSLSRYSGQVVDRPTTFAFAHGAGIMGEGKTPEVIAPLFRDPVSNDMGVKARVEVGSAAPIVIQEGDVIIANTTNAQVNAKRTLGSDGSRGLMIEIANDINRDGPVLQSILKNTTAQKRVI